MTMSVSLVGQRSVFGDIPTTPDAAKAVLRAALSSLNMGKSPGIDLLVVGETKTLRYDEGNKVLMLPKSLYDDLFSAFQVLGATPPWTKHMFHEYVGSPLAKPDIVKRLRAASSPYAIYFALSTSNTGITPSRDVIGEIADFYAGLFGTPAPGTPASGKQRPAWLVPALIGGGLLAAVAVTFAIVRR